MAKRSRPTDSNCNEAEGSSESDDVIVLVDMDGVLCDVEAQTVQFIKRYCSHITPVKKEDRTVFKIFNDYLEQNQDEVKYLMYRKGFFETMLPIEGAIEAIKEIKELKGVDVFICSAPLNSPYCLQEKQNWVKTNLGNCWVEKLILCSDKTLITGDLLIDDKPIIKGAVKKPSWQHVLFANYPYHEAKSSDFKAKYSVSGRTDGTVLGIIRDLQAKISTHAANV